MASESDDETIEYDIEVVESASSISSLDSDSEHELHSTHVEVENQGKPSHELECNNVVLIEEKQQEQPAVVVVGIGEAASERAEHNQADEERPRENEETEESAELDVVNGDCNDQSEGATDGFVPQCREAPAAVVEDENGSEAVVLIVEPSPGPDELVVADIAAVGLKAGDRANVQVHKETQVISNSGDDQIADTLVALAGEERIPLVNEKQVAGQPSQEQLQHQQEERHEEECGAQICVNDLNVVAHEATRDEETEEPEIDNEPCCEAELIGDSGSTEVQLQEGPSCTSIEQETGDELLDQHPADPPADQTQWFECTEASLVEAADWLLVRELDCALQQVSSCIVLDRVEAQEAALVEAAPDQNEPDTVVALAEQPLNLEAELVFDEPASEAQQTEPVKEAPTICRPEPEAETLDDNLEWEFDNEPPFEVKHVELKVDCDARAEYELHEELGRGKFGTVYRCSEMTTGRMFAAKFVLMRRREDREDVRREIEIMSQLQHKRLLQLYDAFDNGPANEMCLITELVEGGELFERIVNDDFELTEKKAAIFMRQICEGVDYMHSLEIVHLDMKPENILCVSKTGNRIKLIDFGLARRLAPDQPLRVMFGTPDFAAPEVLAYDTVSLATDMWSVGVICYVLLSGLSPFMGDNDVETMANVTRATYDFDDQAFDPISDLAKDFIARLLVREQPNRMRPDECLDHPWLQRGGAELEASARSRRQSMTAELINQEQQSAAEALPPEIDLNAQLFSLDKRNLKKYVVRRKWHKTVHAIMALGRMGANLKLQVPQANKPSVIL